MSICVQEENIKAEQNKQNKQTDGAKRNNKTSLSPLARLIRDSSVTTAF
jgi:hypothetical protein